MMLGSTWVSAGAAQALLACGSVSVARHSRNHLTLDLKVSEHSVQQSGLVLFPLQGDSEQVTVSFLFPYL